ncbi:MAG: hypothetical protein H6R26_1133 [Proteobacteria bacterium]|nr:hypothetical protein [Pseudomonadota bacterium]
MAKRIRTIVIVLLVVGYPFLSAYLVRNGWAMAVLLLFAGLSAWRGIKATRTAFRHGYALLVVLLLTGAFLAEDYTVQLIPAFVYLSLAALFGHTLASPPSLCERLVRLQFPEFKPGIAEYLRQLTWVWTGFFVANAVICALLPAIAGEQAWMFYTGVVVYVLMAILATGEYFYRPVRFPDLDIPSPLATFKAIMGQAPQVFRNIER